MIACFFCVCLCWVPKDINLYEFVPGKWNQLLRNGTKIDFEMQEIENTTNDSIKEFRGSIEGNKLFVNVITNNSAHVTFNDYEFDINFIDEKDDVARSDLDLDEYHLSVTVYSTYSFEMVLVKKGTNDILYYGFSKDLLHSTWKEVVICLSISITLTYIIKKFAKSLKF